jgi:hypothetical protein
MGSVVELGRGVHLSLRGLAEETGFDRETLGKRLTAAKVKPSGKRGGHPVYRLRDALKAVYAFASDDGGIDPDKLEPFQRKAHYQAEHEKLKLQTERGELVPRLESEQELARVVKIFVRVHDALPDKIERDCGASPLMVQAIERELDAAREQAYAEILAEDDDAERAALPGA